MDNYHEFSSCEYCCKTGEKDDTNINNNGNNGRCQHKCNPDYGLIRNDEKICPSSL